MTDPLSDAFKATPPTPPTTEGWLDAARRRRRRRSQVLGTALVAGLLAVAVPATIHFTEDNTLVANPADSPTDVPPSDPPVPQPEPNGLPGAAACWTESGEMFVDEGGPGAPTDAARVWFCGDAGPADGFGSVGPMEPLVTGVDELFTYISQAQPAPADQACTMEYTLAYRLVFEQADGARSVVHGELHGCRTIRNGDQVLEGGEGLYTLAQDLWRAQRDDMAEVYDVAMGASCQAPTRALLPPLLENLAAGVGCAGEAVGVTDGAGQVVLDADLVARIVEELETNSTEGFGDGQLPQWLVLTGQWGDPMVLHRVDEERFSWFDGDVAMLWRPSRVLLAELDEQLALAAEPGQGVPGDPGTGETLEPEAPLPSFPAVWEPDACEGALEGGIPTSELEASRLADDPSAVWLCGKGMGDPYSPQGPVAPMDPLSGASGRAQAAVDLYNTLPDPNWDACTDELGPAYLVIHEYADGSRVPVEIQTYGCRAVVTGEQLKAGGQDYLDALLALWAEEREELGTTGERPGPICPRLDSVVAVDPADAVGGVACSGWPDGTGEPRGDGVETLLPPDLVSTVAEQLANSAYPAGYEGMPDGSTLVLQNAYGDPVTLERLDDGTYRWWVDGEYRGWEPPSAVAEALEPYVASGTS